MFKKAISDVHAAVGQKRESEFCVTIEREEKLKPFLFGISLTIRDQLCAKGFTVEHKKILEEQSLSEEKSQLFAFLILEKGATIDVVVEELKSLDTMQCAFLRKNYERGVRSEHIISFFRNRKELALVQYFLDMTSIAVAHIISAPLSLFHDIVGPVRTCSMDLQKKVCEQLIQQRSYEEIINVCARYPDESLLEKIIASTKQEELILGIVNNQPHNISLMNMIKDRSWISRDFSWVVNCIERAKKIDNIRNEHDCKQRQQLAVQSFFDRRSSSEYSFWNNRASNQITLKDLITRSEHRKTFFLFDNSDNETRRILSRDFNVDFKILGELTEHDKITYVCELILANTLVTEYLSLY